MGLYSSEVTEEGLDMNALVEAFLIDDLTHNCTEETVKEFCAPGGVGEALLEAKVLSNKRTLTRLSKKDDLKRREVIAAIRLAAKRNDPLYHKLVKYQALRKQTRMKIVQKYGTKASREALLGQKAYMKAMKGVNVASLSNSAWQSQVSGDQNR